jgi:ketosteroid isomerase-like protein
MPGFISDTPLARDLVRIGDEAVAREDDAALRAYFAEDYVFHGPGGDLGFDELRNRPKNFSRGLESLPPATLGWATPPRRG